MTQASTFKKLNNPNDYRSKVRETAVKFDRSEKLNDLSISPPSSHRSSIEIQINNNHVDDILTSSISSSSGSIPNDYIINSSPKEQTRLPLTSSNDITVLTKPHVSTARIELRPPLQPNKRPPPAIPKISENYPKVKQSVNNENEIEEPEPSPPYTKPMINRREIQFPSSNQNNQSKIRRNSYENELEKRPSHTQNRFKNSDIDSLGLEINQPATKISQQQVIIRDGYFDDERHHRRNMSSTTVNYETTETLERSGTTPLSSRRLPPPPRPPPPPAFAKSFLQQQNVQEEPQSYVPQRSLSLSNFMMELGALLIVFIVCMVLVLAIQEDESKLRITMQVVYTYVYVVSIIWMIWCTFDIIKFRRQWAKLTASARDQDEYMDITERHPHIMFYFPDIHNTGGLFMRIGAGLLCMGGLILTLIEIAKSIANIGSNEATNSVSTHIYSSSVIITKLITYIFRFIFHCVQFTFLFRYGNLVINRYHLVAKIGLIHLVIANFCTWFQAIVIETLERLDKNSDTPSSTDVTHSTTITTIATTINDTYNNNSLFDFIKIMAATNSDSGTEKNKTTLEIIHEIESTMSVYLYPCLIEYSLISLTIFFIMWRNVGKNENRSFLRFGDRHVFTVNCARASRGLLIGGIIFVLTILTLIPIYLLKDDAPSVTHITALVLLVVSLFTVCLSYFYTTKLFYDRHAHVDVFDQVLILITTVGDFAYSFFGLFASIFILESKSKLPVGIEISIGIIAILQTFLQSGFIIDTLKRRTTTKQENRIKPGREIITALLLMNLAIWLHSSLSATKIESNPSQVVYYNASTWAIIQAFTLPLSIFYRFHSSVCLADIWQEVYHDNGDNDGTRSGRKNRMFRLESINDSHDN